MRTALILSVFVTALALVMVNSHLTQNNEALDACSVGRNFSYEDYHRMTVNGTSTREEKCYIACLFNATGVMEDGKPTAKNAEVVANEVIRRAPPETRKGIQDAIEKCSEEVKPTEFCDTAENLRACLYENVKQYIKL